MVWIWWRTILAASWVAFLVDPAFAHGSAFYPPPASAITSAVGWVSDLLTGTLATALAVIAVAAIGFAMLSGRVEIRRGLSIIVGCFLLFGARGIAGGLLSATTFDGTPAMAGVALPPAAPRAPPVVNNGDAFDPYAGAAMRSGN